MMCYTLYSAMLSAAQAASVGQHHALDQLRILPEVLDRNDVLQFPLLHRPEENLLDSVYCAQTATLAPTSSNRHKNVLRLTVGFMSHINFGPLALCYYN